jgi:hypothetical protein
MRAVPCDSGVDGDPLSSGSYATPDNLFRLAQIVFSNIAIFPKPLREGCKVKLFIN